MTHAFVVNETRHRYTKNKTEEMRHWLKSYSLAFRCTATCPLSILQCHAGFAVQVWTLRYYWAELILCQTCPKHPSAPATTSLGVSFPRDLKSSSHIVFCQKVMALHAADDYLRFLPTRRYKNVSDFVLLRQKNLMYAWEGPEQCYTISMIWLGGTLESCGAHH